MQMIREQEERFRFGHFIDTLSEGWEIEEPVLLGAMATTNAYHFVLRKRAEDKTRLMSLRPSPELLVFLSENNLAIQAI